MKHLAKPLRSAMKSRPNNPITPKDLSIAQSLTKSPNLPEAIRIFDSIAATSTSTSTSELDHLRFHNSLLQSYASVSNISDSFSLLRHMVKASPVFKPDRSTYHILLAQSCVAPDPTLSAVHKALNIMSNAGFSPDKVSADIAVRTLVSAGRIESALQLFDEMIVKNTEPDDFTYNFLVKTLCKCRSLGTVQAFIDKTRSSSGPKPDLVTYTILIDNVCNSKNLREMTRLLGVLKDEGFRPDCFLYNTVMKGYCALSRGREAVAVFNEMKESGVSPDMITYNTLIYGLSRAGRAKEAKKYLSEMELEGFSPDVVTYTTLMNGLCRERDPLGAYALLNGMSSRGCEPNSCSYNTMLHGFCKAGMLERAMKLFREMKEVGTEIQSVSYNIMVRNLCRKRMVAEAYEVFDYAVQSKSVTDVAAYVALEAAIKFVNKEREHGRGGDHDWP